MAYANKTTGRDECPETKTQYVKSMASVDRRVLEKLGNPTLWPLTTAVEYYISKLTDSEKQNMLISKNTKLLAKAKGFDNISSGLWGASIIAYKEVNRRLNREAIKKYEIKENSRGNWGIFADCPNAINLYNDLLKDNLETIVNRKI
jgi:hypothetical protein